jgi:hypothetical protein
MMPLASPALPTTLGYSVAYAGTNNSGWWGFDDDGSAILNDSGFTFTGDAFLGIYLNTSGYITSTGT